MVTHCILRPIASDNGVIREGEEGGGSHAQLIHSKHSQADRLTREGNNLASNRQKLMGGCSNYYNSNNIIIPDFELF